MTRRSRVDRGCAVVKGFKLRQRLKKLPPSRVAEVADFVEFLASREERAAAAHGGAGAAGCAQLAAGL
ncbi:MAG TPA: DUF2281 domain-containing protein [Rhizobacter sp.]|nr:DUF2281 domain-containing protein [Rhizobacter sp.]